MEESKIYALLERELLHKWRDEIEGKKNPDWIFAAEKEAFEELGAKLNEQEKELLNSYSHAVDNKFYYIYYNLCIKILNYGIKMGMELQKAFSDYEQ